MSLRSNEIENYFNFILPLVKEAGENFMEVRDKAIIAETKSAHDLVTEYDRKIENNIVTRIKTTYPHHKIIGEEGSELSKDNCRLTNEPTWIIDPIDGTTNFTRKIPECGISVGFLVNKEQTLGLVYAPYLNELYTAVKGRGAYLNGEKIQCSNVTDPGKSLFCYEFAVTSRNSPEKILEKLKWYLPEVFAVRSLGCPVLSQCYVASGKFDAYQGDGLHPWDAAAGTLIVKEAGGYIIESSGREFNIMEPNFLVTATKELSDSVLTTIDVTMSDSDNVQTYMDFVLPLVLQSGQELLSVEEINPEVKNGNDWDVVTIYDRKIEELLQRKLKEKYADHRFIGEEESSSKKNISRLTDDPTWIIDPIDGTANFVKKMPVTCISVGLTIKKEQVLGIVYNPYMNELFTAMKGKGSYLNGKRITTSGETEIKRSIFNYELSLAIQNDLWRQIYMSRLNHLINEISGIRSYGSAALGLCYVACGRIDAYQCDGLYPWDAAAGTLIVQEAGGHVIDSAGGEFDLMKPNFLATSTETLSEQFARIERVADDWLARNKESQFVPDECSHRNGEKTK